MTHFAIIRSGGIFLPTFLIGILIMSCGTAADDPGQTPPVKKSSTGICHDKARAVVDAMERDMGTTIATKADLQLLKQDMATRTDVAELRQAIALIHKDLELLASTMTIRLGSMLMLGLGLLFAALKLI